MTCYNIYKIALALLGEPADSTGCTDYRNRTPLLLRIIVARLAPISALIDGKNVTPQELSLNSEFPLSELLAPCASEMLASMLIFDEIPELAEALMIQAEKDRDLVGSSTPIPDIGSTHEVYVS